MIFVLTMIVVGKQGFRFIVRLVIVETLAVNEGSVDREVLQNVNRAVHVRVDQANQFVIACFREFYRKSCATTQTSSCGHACAAIVARRRSARHPHGCEWRSCRRRSTRASLPGREETNRVGLVLGNKGPRDAVALKKPEFIREKCVRLDGLIFGLSSNIRVVRRRRLGRRRQRSRLPPATSSTNCLGTECVSFAHLEFLKSCFPWERKRSSVWNDFFHFSKQSSYCGGSRVSSLNSLIRKNFSLRTESNSTEDAVDVATSGI